MIYEPMTTIGVAALTCWRNIGTQRTSLQEAERVLRSIRLAKPDVILRVARETGFPLSTVDLVWVRMIDAILAQEAEERRALDLFEARRSKGGEDHG